MQEKDFISYEYKTVSVKAKDEARTMDLYEAFGWEVSNAAASVTGNATLSFRRDRKQRHRAELTKLERQAEQTLETLRGLERAKTLGAGVGRSVPFPLWEGAREVTFYSLSGEEDWAEVSSVSARRSSVLSS